MTENMSFGAEDQTCDFPERVGFFIGSDSEESRGSERDAAVRQQQQRLRQILHTCASAPSPEHLSALVQFVLENFKKTSGTENPCVSREESEAAELDCPGCLGLLWEPVTAPCGHTYCKACLLHCSFTRCIICRQETGPNLRTNVLLCGLLEKWCPEQVHMWRRVSEAEGLLRTGHFDEAVSITNQLLDRDPGNVRVRACRAEAYRGLLQYRRALDDWEECSSTTMFLEVAFCKAKLLKEMGRVDQSLKLFLQCLSVDEDFKQAKQEVESILRDLLWPACESVQASLKQNTHNPLAHLQKAAGMSVHVEPGSAHLLPEEAEQMENPEHSGLIRAQSLRSHSGSRAGGEGLKRVSSAPQLGALQKRKLSGLEPGVSKSEDTKHKKAGAPAQEPKTQHTVPREKLDPSDFECSLCMRLLYEPVTTPCGHSFCKNCLQRCLDHSPHCPLCKESLKLYLASRNYFITHVIDDIIKHYLHEEHAGRQKVHNDETKELSDLQNNVPVFVCTMAYPTVPCPLHVFEPRYRLMIRRCMDTGTRQFGMCIHDPKKGFADVGCMLHIRNVHFLPDGRSVVDTVGGKRFRVVTRSMRDGYSIANIKYLQDQKVGGEQEQELQDLYDQVYNQASVWFHSLENRFRNQILQHFGPMPEKESDIQSSPNGPACCWWLLAVLPVDPRYQLSLLSMVTLKERLVKIQHILTYLQNSHPPE